MIHVIATIRTAAGRREDLLAAFGELIPLVRAETGCIEYGPAVDLATPIGAAATVRHDVVTILEKWDSVEALQAHLAAEHMMRHRERVSGMVAGVEIRILAPA